MTVQKDNKSIFVTQPSILPRDQYVKLLDCIWEKGHYE